MAGLFGSRMASERRVCNSLHTRILCAALLASLCITLFAPPVQASQTSTYGFLPYKSTITQTGGIAGIHRTYTITGTFQLTADFDAGTASFDGVDANAVDDSPFRHTLDPNEVFNMTELSGTIIDRTTTRFEGTADDGSSVLITLTFTDDTVTLKGETIPPPNSADFFLFALDAVAQRKYSGGTGEPNDPYQIATAADLMALGETPEDYGKHFILTADIDLDPNLLGRKVFDKAVIAPDTDPNDMYSEFKGTYFTGVFDGKGHVISHLTIMGHSDLGLFGCLGSGAEIRDLGVVDINILGSGNNVGGLVGSNSTRYRWIRVVLGGRGGFLYDCYSAGLVVGNSYVGGLVGYNGGHVAQCYSTATVSGDSDVGGLVGRNGSGMPMEDGGACGSIFYCYSVGAVTGNRYVGGLLGPGDANNVLASFWDTQTSGQITSAGGIGKTTVEMQTAKTFLDAGWDFVGETANGSEDIWKIAEGLGYPRLSWQKYSGGTGEPNDPYQIATAADLIALGETPEDYGKHFILTADIDLDPNLPGRKVFDKAVIAPDTNDAQSDFQGTPFTGVFDGNGHTISYLTVNGWGYLGLLGKLGQWPYSAGEVKNLGVVDANITGLDSYFGGLVGYSSFQSTVSNCYATGQVTGGFDVGGLVGYNGASVIHCYSVGSVSGGYYVGGLVGFHQWGSITANYSTAEANGRRDVGGLVGRINGTATVTHSYSTGTVSGDSEIGGLVGWNWQGTVTQCYSTGAVIGQSKVGGLVGLNWRDITQCYSTGAVSGNDVVGGLVGGNSGEVTDCYSMSAVSGDNSAGGLVGVNWAYGRLGYPVPGLVARCYSTGAVTGRSDVGGLVGQKKYYDEYWGNEGVVNDSFWDIQNSGQATSEGGMGKTTAEMQMASTFLDAGWDFVGETANGTEDIWWILEGKDYPRLSWQLPADDFEDGKAGPLWFAYEVDTSLVQIKEANGRLETTASAEAQNVDAFYVSDGWRLDATKGFAIRVDFHFSQQGGGDGRVTLGVVPGLDPSAMQWAELEAGCFNTGPFYLYEVRDGSWVEEVVADRSSDGGTLYMSYNPDTDELYFSHSGYGKANAWQTVKGLLKGRWASTPVYVILGGGSEGMALTGADAWMDNFAVSSGALILN